MGENAARILIGKVILKGRIALETGMHIGGSLESMQIGGVDLPVIKDAGSNLPYIPGSSLKGKLRSTLEKFGERRKNGKLEKLTYNRNIGPIRSPVFIHCCEDVRYALECDVCRIFGSSGDDKGVPRGQKAENFPSLLLVRDCLLDESLMHPSQILTEVKTETGLDRTTMAANPRKVERVLPGTIFNFDMVYSAEAISLGEKSKPQFSEEKVRKDLNNILTCMGIVQSEGIGGYSSRGYGKVAFMFTQFMGRSLAHFQGTSGKETGKASEDGFTIDVAREQIKDIVSFFQGEFGDEAAG